MGCADVRSCLEAQLIQLRRSQTDPFTDIVSSYQGLLRHCRELEVRVGQLNKEAEELRDENQYLRTHSAVQDEWAVQAAAAQGAQDRVELQRAQTQLMSLYRERGDRLEELAAARNELDRLRKATDDLSSHLQTANAEVESLHDTVRQMSVALASEKQAARLAADEAQARLNERDDALTRLARLEAEHAALTQRVIDQKLQEAERLNDINRMHEEAMENAQRLQAEASADRLSREQLRRSSDSGSASGGGGLGSRLASLRQIVGIGVDKGSASGAAAAAERKLPTGPSKVVPDAHKGGVCSLTLDATGRLVATAGVDRVVKCWDTVSMEVTNTYHGSMGQVNDVSFTCDGAHVLGACGDKRLLMWNTRSAQARHTLTGHTGSVTCVSCSPAHATRAVSCAEDRSVKLWDLNRGYATRSLPCSKMPNALCLSLDGSVLLTGHLDNVICLWDMRQCERGEGRPLADMCPPNADRQPVLGIYNTATDSIVLACSKDNVLRLWDFRTMSVLREFRSPAFVAGSMGSMGKGHCRVDLSADMRFLAAGAADGSVYVWDAGAAAAGGTGGAGACGREAAALTRGHKEAVVAVGWSGDCSLLVSGGKGGVLVFWQCPKP